MANTVLTRTPSSAGNQKTWTYSMWFKRAHTGIESALFSVGDSPSTNMCMLRFDPDKINFYSNDTNAGRFSTKAKFRDTNGWYHVVMAFNSTLASSDDRLKFYVNGQRISTSDMTGVNTVVQNTDSIVNSTSTIYIGERPDDNAHFDGIMSHIHFIDGTAYDASYFGETDATTGEWKINTSPSVTYGTNGFFILKDGNSVTDQSGNSNNFTVAGGTLTKTEDSPSNVFAVINALDSTSANASNPVVISNGNTVLTGTNTSGGIVGACATIAVSQGKYYFEVSRLGTANYAYVGVVKPGIGNITNITGTLPICSYRNNGSTYSNLSVGTQATWNTDGDIIMCAMDMDNGAIYFGKNGSWLNSGNPLSGATQTGAFGSFTPNSSDYYAPLLAGYNTSSGVRANFGNGYFGTTAVSSAGTNASGIGIFEYDVPTGYTALSTKGLNL